MRKIMFFLLSLCIMGGCQSQTDHNSDKLQVYTSFYPMQSLAEEIGQGFVEVVNMTPQGEEAHDYEPSVQDIAGLESADVFVYNGADMEHWVEDITDAIDTNNLLIVNASEHVELMNLEGKETADPHTWLSLRNAIVQVETIVEAFIQADPTHEEEYRSNADTLIEKMEALDVKYATLLAPYEGEVLAVAHASFGYLCRDYGFTQLAVDGLSSESEPSPAKMKEMIETIKSENISVIFYEGVSNSKVAETIAEETGIQIGTLSTLESLSDEEQEQQANYLTIMESNLEALYHAFQS